MSMMDPFNPRPGSLPGEDRHQHYRDLEAQQAGKSFLWVPVAIVGFIGVMAVVASL